MPFEEIREHILFVMNYVVDVEPQFKNHFLEQYTEDGSNEAVESALQDNEINHVWKSAYLIQQFVSGNTEVEVIVDDSEDADSVREDFEVGNLD